MRWTTRWQICTALALAAMGALAQGEALDIELPSMRTPVPPGPGATRDEVRESRDRARDTGRMGEGELADRPSVLRAREDFNALQAEVLAGPSERRP